MRSGREAQFRKSWKIHPEGFEPPTLGSEDRCAIQLRHGCVFLYYAVWLPHLHMMYFFCSKSKCLRGVPGGNSLNRGRDDPVCWIGQAMYI